MKTPTYERGDTSIENVIAMVGPMLGEYDLLNRAIPVRELSRVCRNRQASLPIRSYGVRRLVGEIDFLCQGGGFVVGGYEVYLSGDGDSVTRRTTYYVTITQVVDCAPQRIQEVVKQ